MNKNIFDSEHISRNMMISLLDGKVNAKQRIEATAHISSCDLCRDAYNGLKQMPDTKALQTLNNKWNRVSSKHKLKRIELNLNAFYILFTFVLVILIAITYLFFFHQSKQTKSESHPVTIVAYSDFKYSAQPESFVTSSKVDSIIDKSSVDPKQSDPPDIKSNPKDVVEPIEIKSPEKVKSFANAEPVEKDFNKIKTKALRDLIIIDYSDKYANQKEAWKNLNNGLAARYATKDAADSVDFTWNKSKQTTSYEAVFENAFINLSLKKYDKSIEDFNFILQYFPEDLNCIFYTGFALESSFKSKEALPYYTQIINYGNPVFGDAAKFHAALCFIELSNLQESKALLNSLIEAKSFYASQAKEKLSEMK